MEVKRMPIADFRDQGYLMELNRRFLHPLGLALESVVEEDGSEHLGGVWDYREEPGGMTYAGFDEVDAEKSIRIEREWEDKAAARREALGYVVQPVMEGSLCAEDKEPIHLYFGLSYANYLVIHRSILQSMPIRWQRSFVALLETLDRVAFAWSARENIALPTDFEVNAKEGEKTIDDPVPPYDRGRTRLDMRAEDGI